MTLPVNLQEVVDAMDGADGDQMTAYINVKTGELHTIIDLGFSMDFDEDDDEGGWEREVLEKDAAVDADEDFIELPSKYDIHEYRIMENFIATIDDRRLHENLSRAIQGRGAFRRFKDETNREGVREAWYAFRNNALKKIAADFLEAMEIPYLDDRPADAPEVKKSLSDPDEALIGDLERRLLKPKVRKSRQKVAELLDDAFTEFGSSGKVFDKGAVIEAMQDETGGATPKRSVFDLKVRKLAPEVALVTYRATRQASGDLPERHSLRSSVWVLNDGRWQMLFHQGTRYGPPPAM